MKPDARGAIYQTMVSTTPSYWFGAADRCHLTWLATVGLRGASFVLSTVVVLLLYRFVPARGLRVRDGVVGAIVTALLLQLISLASAWIYEKTTELSVIYGSLTAVLVFLYSLYLFASALLLGAEVAAAWCRPHTESGEGGPILTQLKRAGRGLFARQKT